MLTVLSALISRNALAIAACAGLLAWGALAVKKHDQEVARVAVAKIEKATDNATRKGKRAAERSATPSVRGTRDPSTRDD